MIKHRFEPKNSASRKASPFNLPRSRPKLEMSYRKRKMASKLSRSTSRRSNKPRADCTLHLNALIDHFARHGRSRQRRNHSHVMSGIIHKVVASSDFAHPIQKSCSTIFCGGQCDTCGPRHDLDLQSMYYEEVLVVRVHPEFLVPQNLPPFKKLSDLWKQRYAEILAFEQTLVNSGTSVLKFFLHISKTSRKRRLLERLKQKKSVGSLTKGISRNVNSCMSIRSRSKTPCPQRARNQRRGTSSQPMINGTRGSDCRHHRGHLTR